MTSVIYLIGGTAWIFLWARAQEHTQKIHIVIGIVAVAGSIVLPFILNYFHFILKYKAIVYLIYVSLSSCKLWLRFRCNVYCTCSWKTGGCSCCSCNMYIFFVVAFFDTLFQDCKFTIWLQVVVPNRLCRRERECRCRKLFAASSWRWNVDAVG